jgi:hypothetical protein
MALYSDGLDNQSVSTTETLVNIPKDTVSLQVTNRDTTNRVIISLGKTTGRCSLIIPAGGAKNIDLVNIMQYKNLTGQPWDWGNDGFGGVLTHRTAASTATIDIEYTALSGS